jgi:hypothetical protein
MKMKNQRAISIPVPISGLALVGGQIWICTLFFYLWHAVGARAGRSAPPPPPRTHTHIIIIMFLHATPRDKLEEVPLAPWKGPGAIFLRWVVGWGG